MLRTFTWREKELDNITKFGIKIKNEINSLKTGI